MTVLEWYVGLCDKVRIEHLHPMSFWILQLLNGISFGMLLFLFAAGLSLIYGLMKILNLHQGSFYLLGDFALAVAQELIVSFSRFW